MRLACASLLALSLTACTHVGVPPSGGKYVAMGSSFAAGAGIGPTKPGTPERCQRTDLNYASLLARELHLTLDDQGCGGARTEHVLGPWEELPAQIEAVTADTRLVTITVGGNDLNYIGNLFMAGCNPDTGMRAGGQVRPCKAMQLPSEAEYVRVRDQLTRIGQEVRRRAPEATMVFVQYVTLVPQDTCPALRLTREQAAGLRELGLMLAEMTRDAAEATGAKVLHADRLSEGHTACSELPWSKAAPIADDPVAGAPWHPNAAGHAAIADALASMLRG